MKKHFLSACFWAWWLVACWRDATEAETTAELEAEETEAETETTAEESADAEDAETTTAAKEKDTSKDGNLWADFDNMSFKINGKTYTLGKTTLQEMIDDGVCGVSEIIDWVSTIQIEKDIVDAAKSTIVSKATDDPLEQAKILALVEAAFQNTVYDSSAEEIVRKTIA